MKKVAVLIGIILFSCNYSKPLDIKVEDSFWNIQKREEYLNNLNDSTTWNHQMLNNDKQMIGIGDLGPFKIGVFPVPNYDLLGNDSFKGIGNTNKNFKLGKKTLIMNSFFVAKNQLNKERLKEKKDEVFFQIIVLTDTLDTVNYNLNKSIAISRNHPDYVAQGFVKTKHNTIDYFAFKTIENETYAIVNTRLFNLNFGKTILIAPQKDSTLRSLQIKSPKLDSHSILDYTKDFIKNNEVNLFFNNKDNI